MLTIDEFPRSLQVQLRRVSFKRILLRDSQVYLVIIKLSIIITSRQYGIEIIERLLCYDSLSLILLWTFVKAFGIDFCYISSDGN